MTEILIIAGLIVVSLGLVGHSVLSGRGNQKDVMMRRARGKGSVDERVEIQKKAKQSAAASLMKKAAPVLSRPMMPRSDEEQSTLRIKLANAGFRRDSAPVAFLGSKTLLGVGVGAVTLLMTAGSGQDAIHVFSYTAMAGGLGFMLPNLWLSLATSQRMEKIGNGLPDALDLMVISVESGLGLDAAIQRVGDELEIVHPELCEELQITAMESQMGVPRAESLDNMATRTNLPQMRSLVAIIVQAERFGTSIAKALRNQADAMRLKRRQAAQERAQKTAVKLMLPLILFIFPAMFVVLAGPAGLQLVRQLGGGGPL